MGALYEEALKAVKALFNDRSVPAAVTLAELEELADEIDTYIQALRSDIIRAEESD